MPARIAFISVVLPAWNAGGTLAEAITSVLDQSQADFELLIVDDGSTDDTLAIAQGFTDPRVRVLALPHGGIVAALTAGLAAARGDAIARMDADDVMHPHRLSHQCDALNADADLGLVGCLVAHAGLAGDTRGYAAYVDWLNGIATPAAISLRRFVESPFAHPSVMFRASVVSAHGGYREGPFPEDYELWLRWLAAGVKMAKVPETLLTWRDHPERLSRTHARYGVEAFYALKASWLARWLRAKGHDTIVVWGSGKLSRQRLAFLRAEGIAVSGYIDVDPKRTISEGLPIRHPSTLSGPDGSFVVSYVGVRGAGDYIHGQLTMRGWVEGEHFLLAA